MELIELAIVALMVMVNAVFAAYEIALASVSVSQLQVMVSQNRKGAKAALEMKEGIEKSLAVVQLGITLVGLIAGATGGASASEDIAPYLMRAGLGRSAAQLLAILLVVVPLTAITIVLGELMPKLFALRNKEWVCLRLSPLMKFFSISALPLVWALEFSASGIMDTIEKLWTPKVHPSARQEALELQELRAIASMARTSRLIGAREENIILGAARMASRRVHEIMLPAEHIRSLCLSDSLSNALISAHLDLHTRFPVCEVPHDPQTIVGFVNFKDIVTAMKLNPKEPSVRGILRDILSIQSDTTIASALEFLLKERTHIALVRDKGSSVLGMITLEDIVEELVGDIQDEHDLLPFHIIRSGSGWIIGGGSTLARIKEMTGIELSPTNQTQNLSTWATEKIGVSPQGSEIVRHGNARLLVRKVRRQRVLEAALSVDEAKDSVTP